MRAQPPHDLRGFVHAGLHGLGIDIIRYSSTHFFELRRQKLIRRRRISLVLDVGANSGQYAMEIRRRGYRGRIVSFEPLSSAFQELRRNAALDALWAPMRLALGDEDGTATINVSRNSWSSSLLPLGPRHLSNAPDSAYVGTEEVSLARLDSVAPDLLEDDDEVLMKLDVQGYELRALLGSERTLEHVDLIEAELSLVPLYPGQALLEEVVAFLSERGFAPVWLEPGLYDERADHLLQVDVIFERRDNQRSNS